MDDRPADAPREAPTSAYLTKCPGEAPSVGLRRVRADAPREVRGRIKYLPHGGARERARNLRRLALARGTAVEACRVCGVPHLLDALGDLPDGRLACAACLMREEGVGDAR